MFGTAKKSEKITDVIISQVRGAILSGELKPGDRLASEKELVEQFDVSKATLRESLRALEAMGFIESRKGASGGVFVTEVTLQTTIHSMMNFLHFKSLSISEITMIRYIMEPIIVRIAATQITEKDIRQLETFISADRADPDGGTKKDISFHRYLSRITSNSMLILIVDFIESHLDEIKQSLRLDSSFYNMVRKAHQDILDCLRAGDKIGASRAMAHDVVEVGRYMSKEMGEKSFDPSDYDLDNTVADRGPLSELSSPITGSTSDEIEIVNLTAEQLGNAKVLKRSGSADLYLIVPRDAEKTGE